MNYLLLAFLLAIPTWLFSKKMRGNSKNIYQYRRQPWISHILKYLDDGDFFEAEEMTAENIKKYPQISEYKLLQIKILTAAGNLARAKALLKAYLDDELEPGYQTLFNLYSAYLIALEDNDKKNAAQIFGSNPPQPNAPCYGLYKLWLAFINNDDKILVNFEDYPHATRAEEAERSFLSALTLQKSKPKQAKQLLNKAIQLAPKSYFARKAKGKVKR